MQDNTSSTLQATSQEFFRALYPHGIPLGTRVVAVSFPGPTDIVVHTKLDALSMDMAAHPEVNRYFSCLALDGEKLAARRKDKKRSRGTAADVAGAPGIYVDLDTKRTHPDTATYKTPKEAHWELMTRCHGKHGAPPPPSLVVWSGGGLQAWWLFSTFWKFWQSEECEDLKYIGTAQDFVKLTTGFHRWLEAYGLDVDAGVGRDLARVFRAPGSFNQKAGLKKEYRRVKMKDANGVTYLHEWLETQVKKYQMGAPTPAPEIVFPPGDPEGVFDGVVSDGVFSGTVVDPGKSDLADLITTQSEGGRHPTLVRLTAALLKKGWDLDIIQAVALQSSAGQAITRDIPRQELRGQTPAEEISEAIQDGIKKGWWTQDHSHQEEELEEELQKMDPEETGWNKAGETGVYTSSEKSHLVGTLTSDQGIVLCDPTPTPEEVPDLEVKVPYPGKEASPEELIAWAQALPLWTADQFSVADIEPPEVLLKPWLSRGEMGMVFGTRGSGKTFVAMGIGFTLATGTKMGSRWRANGRHRVLYLDGEMPKHRMQERIRMLEEIHGQAGDYLQFMGHYHLGRDFRLTELHDRFAVNTKLKMMGADVLVVDNLSASHFSEDENDNNLAWGDAGEWVMKLRRRGVTVILIHHAGKGGEQRGASRREDFLDFSIRITPLDPENQTGTGLLSKVGFSKFRSDDGKGAAKPFEISLPIQSQVISESEDGQSMERPQWVTRPCGSANAGPIVSLYREGKSQREIADLVESPKTGKNISQATVTRELKKAIRLGLLSQEEFEEIAAQNKAKGAAAGRQKAIEMEEN